ncbi:MAG: hypothetical protein Q4C37_08735 [Bacteroidales bacterium]|nr:hypothetical protein [Bacteroidales bacterium]
MGSTNQPFKFGGKELISANGLNMYDFSARLRILAVSGRRHRSML